MAPLGTPGLPEGPSDPRSQHEQWSTPQRQEPHGVDRWDQRPARGNFNITRVPLKVLMWNVRGLNAPKK